MKKKLISETIGTLFLLLIVVGSESWEKIDRKQSSSFTANSIATAFGLIVLI